MKEIDTNDEPASIVPFTRRIRSDDREDMYDFLLTRSALKVVKPSVEIGIEVVTERNYR